MKRRNFLFLIWIFFACKAKDPLKPSTLEDLQTACTGNKNLVAFYLDWHETKMPFLEKINRLAKKQTELNFFLLELDDFQELADELKIQNLPSIIIFNGLPAMHNEIARFSSIDKNLDQKIKELSQKKTQPKTNQNSLSKKLKNKIS